VRIPTATDRNKELARRLYLEVFGAGNVDAADEIMAADCISHGPGAPPALGTNGIKLQSALLSAAIPDLNVTLEAQIAEGDRVASQWVGRGSFTGEFRLPGLALPPTGAPISFNEIRIDRVLDGRIIESWFIPDRLTLWQQLGLFPPQSSATSRNLDGQR
jgi:predicted ester cyclase